MKRFAVFDIDGTIFRWQLYHGLFDELHRRGHISDSTAKPVFEARDSWRDRDGSFLDYEYVLIDVMEASIIGLPEATLIDAADAVIHTQGRHTYRYTTELLASLREQDYTVIAISGSQQPIVERFAALYSIDIAKGRVHSVKDGLITDGGPPVYGNKANLLKEIVSDNQLDWRDSYAIGDTRSDADMMELVDSPIAFNPDRELFDRARKEGWDIVVERKNIIYKLRSDGSTFVLA